jgi:hypothetical protein
VTPCTLVDKYSSFKSTKSQSFRWQPEVCILLTLRPSYLSHVTVAATYPDEYRHLHRSDCRNTLIYAHSSDLWHHNRLANVTCAFRRRLCGFNPTIPTLTIYISFALSRYHISTPPMLGRQNQGDPRSNLSIHSCENLESDFLLYWKFRTGLANMRPSVTWIVSAVQFNQYSEIGLHIYYHRKCLQIVAHHCWESTQQTNSSLFVVELVTPTRLSFNCTFSLTYCLYITAF